MKEEDRFDVQVVCNEQEGKCLCKEIELKLIPIYSLSNTSNKIQLAWSSFYSSKSTTLETFYEPMSSCKEQTENNEPKESDRLLIEPEEGSDNTSSLPSSYDQTDLNADVVLPKEPTLTGSIRQSTKEQEKSSPTVYI